MPLIYSAKAELAMMKVMRLILFADIYISTNIIIVL